MTCRTSSACATRPERHPAALVPATGRPRAVFLAAALFLHAAGIAAFVAAKSDTPTRAAPLTVALRADDSGQAQPSLSEPAEPAAARPAVESRPSTVPRLADSPAGRKKAIDTLAAVSSSGGIAASDANRNAVPATAMAGAHVAAKSEVSIPAHYAAGNRKPDYPLLSRRLAEEGTVVLRVLVREDGRAGQVLVRRSSGHALLDESALAAVETWRFRPATVDAVAVSEWYQVAIPFTLHN